MIDLVDERGGRVLFVVFSVTFVLDFPLSQMFLMFFRESVGSKENESDALMPEDFSYNDSYTKLVLSNRKIFYDFSKSSTFILKFGRGFLNE